jgi:hypothetical protein
LNLQLTYWVLLGLAGALIFALGSSNVTGFWAYLGQRGKAHWRSYLVLLGVFAGTVWFSGFPAFAYAWAGFVFYFLYSVISPRSPMGWILYFMGKERAPPVQAEAKVNIFATISKLLLRTAYALVVGVVTMAAFASIQIAHPHFLWVLGGAIFIVFALILVDRRRTADGRRRPSLFYTARSLWVTVALVPAYRNQSVYRFYAGLKRHGYRLATHHARSYFFHWVRRLGGNRSFAV